MISMSAVTLEDKQIRFHFSSSLITSLHFIIIRMKTEVMIKTLIWKPSMTSWSKKKGKWKYREFTHRDQPKNRSCRDNKCVWKVCVNENRVGLSVFHSSGIKVRSMSHSGLVFNIPVVSVMLNGIALLFVLATVTSPVLCCDWLAHFGHLSHQSLSLIRIMVSPLWNSYWGPAAGCWAFWRWFHWSSIEK